MDCTVPECGDGTVNASAGEDCETLGDIAGCDADCTYPTCGDGHANLASAEQCDDGNGDDSDFCTPSCHLASCDDGIGNGYETDVDCGGEGGCNACISGLSCVDDSDCQSGMCFDGSCRVVTSIVTGSYHSCALSVLGEVRCWGFGTYGQLGYGTTESRGDDGPLSSTAVAIGETAVQLAAGWAHTCALLDSGGVRCWGYNAHGQLGDGTRNNRLEPLPGNDGDVDVGGSVVQIAAGHHHTCASLDDGAVRCWGRDHAGQLGLGDTVHRELDEVPSDVLPISLGGMAIQLVAGGNHACALLRDGNIRCWGENLSGELGYGNTETVGDDEVPSDVEAIRLDDRVIGLAAGSFHTCARLDTDAIRCWGRNNYGQLGYGHTRYLRDASAVRDIPIGAAVKEITAGGDHTCAVLDTDAVRCWGRNEYGQLGRGHNYNLSVSQIPEAGGNVVLGDVRALQVAAGELHACAGLDTGAIRCWGRNDSGQLGYGNTVPVGQSERLAVTGNVEIDPPGMTSNVTGVAIGSWHTCVRFDTGLTRCWGRNSYGELGQGNIVHIGDDEQPSAIGNIVLGGAVRDIAAGSSHTCALLDIDNDGDGAFDVRGAVRCWGYNGHGQRGCPAIEGIIGDNETADHACIVALAGEVRQVVTGYHHSCALQENGNVYCWGHNIHGQLGYGHTYSIFDPAQQGPVSVANEGSGEYVIQLTAGYYHTCALLNIGDVRCWGRNDYGQLGYGHTSPVGDDDDEIPSVVGDVDVGATVTAIAAGGQYTCALLDSGQVRCWGLNNYGQLGNNDTAPIGANETPAEANKSVIIGPGTVLQLTAGGSHTCALLEHNGGNKSARCWGYNASGALGYDHDRNIGSSSNPGFQVATAGDVLVDNILSIHAGSSGGHTCAVVQDGTRGAVRCWGYNYYGQLGYANIMNRGAGSTPATAGDVQFEGP